MLTNVIVVLGSLIGAVPDGPQPCLLFSTAEISAIRRRLDESGNVATWQDILARASDYCSVNSSRYADPEALDQPIEGVRIQVLAHHFGRRLTEYMQTLGFAYQMTGERRYAEHGVKILVATAEKLPASDERVAKSFAGARGDLMRGYALGLDWLGETMTDAQRSIVEETAAEYVRVLINEGMKEETWWVPSHNFMGVAFGAAGCLAIKLRDRFPDEAPSWIRICAERITKWFDEGFDDQGAYFEGAGYAQYGLSNAVLFADALRRNGGPNLFDHPHLRQVPHFFAMSLLPGERVFDARNDSHYRGFSDPFMLRLAGEFDSPPAKWLVQQCSTSQSPIQLMWENDVPAKDPRASGESEAEHFVGRGLCVFRTGWRSNSVMFATEAGPFHPVTHNQADKGHFTLHGLGHRWAIDSGYGNNREPGGRDQTVAHNCVLIDGEGQALSGAGAGTNGRIVKYDDNPGYGYALCDATEAYNVNSKGQPGATVRHALRHCLLVRPSGAVPAYAIVLDDIEKDDAKRDYTWLLHTDEHNTIEISDAGVTILPQSISGGAFVETPSEVRSKGSCTWAFATDEPGDYVVWARVRARGETAPQSDSFYVQVDDGTPVAWHMPNARRWTWGRVADGVPAAPVSFPLQPGQHTLRFLTREAGAQVDRILITTDPNAAPPFIGIPDMIPLEAEAGTVSAPMHIVREDGPAPARMKLFLHAAEAVRFEVDAYEVHPRLKATTLAVNPEFVAVMLPLPGDAAVPQVQFCEQSEALIITVAWPTRADRITWPTDGDRVPAVKTMDLQQ